MSRTVTITRSQLDDLVRDGTIIVPAETRPRPQGALEVRLQVNVADTSEDD